ncbi:MAG: hypothetical protein MUC42_06110 [Bryobacter sp.]|jgi:hypothetical protein|nr:hypothetical protein [Bryobacter sp.]
MEEAGRRERERAYLKIWRENGPILQALRDEEIRAANTVEAIQSFRSAFQKALRELPCRPDSGLVHWQDLMRKMRERGG